MNLIKRVFSACLITVAVFLLIIIGAGGMILDLLGAAASGLLAIAAVGAACDYMEDD